MSDALGTSPPPDITTTYEAGEGPDTLALRVSGTSYLDAMPQFVVSVDGLPIQQVFTVTADHGAGLSDTVALHGSWGPGAHDVQITFLNDAFNEAADWSDPATAMLAGDRNLFLDAASYNGTVIQGAPQGIFNAWGDWGSFSIAPAHTAPDPSTTNTGILDALVGLHASDPTFNVDEYLATNGITLADVQAYQDTMNEAYFGAYGVDPGTFDALHPAGDLTAILKPESEDGTFDFNGMSVRMDGWHDFGDGLGPFTHLWGDVQLNTDAGMVSAFTSPNFLEKAGLMMPPGDETAGYTYGVNVFAATFDPNGVGGYLNLWPGNDMKGESGPTPEIDLAEIRPDGVYKTVYATVHGPNGEQQSVTLDGIDPTQPHFYWADWQRDSLTMGVDDQVFFRTTDTAIIPKAAVDGGINMIPSIGEDTPPWLNHQDGQSSVSMFAFAHFAHADQALL